MQSTIQPQRSAYNFSAAIASALLLAASGLFYFLIRIDAAQSSSMAVAILLDFTVTVPFFYWLIVRKKNVISATVIPLAMVGLGIGWLILPPEHSQLVSQFAYVFCPAVAIVVATICVKTVARISHTFRTHTSPCKVTRIESIVKSALGGSVFATSISQEVTMCYYLLRPVSREQPGVTEFLEAPSNSNLFSYHCNSGITALLLVGVMIVSIEIAAVHVLIAMFSHLLAWLASASSVYFAFLIVAQTRAVRSRPTYLHEEELHVRNGMFNLISIGLNNIAAVKMSSRDENSSKPTLNASFPASHNIVIVLKEPVEAKLLYGQSKMVDSILLHVDEPDRLASALQQKTD